jgi:hypothetical protein
VAGDDAHDRRTNTRDDHGHIRGRAAPPRRAMLLGVLRVEGASGLASP